MGWRQKAPGIVGAGTDWRVGWSRRAHLHRWSISNLGARLRGGSTLHGAMEGAELLPRLDSGRRSWQPWWGGSTGKPQSGRSTLDGRGRGRAFAKDVLWLKNPATLIRCAAAKTRIEFNRNVNNIYPWMDSSKESYLIYASLPLNLAISQNRGESIRYSTKKRAKLLQEPGSGSNPFQTLHFWTLCCFDTSFPVDGGPKFGRYFTSGGEIKVISPLEEFPFGLFDPSTANSPISLSPPGSPTTGYCPTRVMRHRCVRELYLDGAIMGWEPCSGRHITLSDPPTKLPPGLWSLSSHPLRLGFQLWILTPVLPRIRILWSWLAPISAPDTSWNCTRLLLLPEAHFIRGGHRFVAVFCILNIALFQFVPFQLCTFSVLQYFSIVSFQYWLKTVLYCIHSLHQDQCCTI